MLEPSAEAGGFAGRKRITQRVSKRRQIVDQIRNGSASAGIQNTASEGLPDAGAFPRTYPVNLRLAGNTGTRQNRTVSRSLTTGRIKNSVTGKVRRATGVRISIGCALRVPAIIPGFDSGSW